MANNDILICSLQHYVDWAKKIFDKIDNQSNPAYINLESNKWLKAIKEDNNVNM